MRSLEARLSRLEERAKRKNNRAPTQHEFLEANARQRVRRAYNAKLRLYRNIDGGENRLWESLSERSRNVLETDTPDQRRKDEDVEERWRRVHGPSDSGHANAARQRLRSMERVGVAE